MDVFHFPPDQNYDCLQCGRGCQAGWEIPVEPAIRQGLEGSPLSLRVIQERGSVLLAKNGGWVLNMSPQQPSCGFLEEQRYCAIHREMGPLAKPTTCRLFPLVLTETPAGTYVGLSFSCSAVRQNVGRPLDQHREWVEQMLAAGASRQVVAQDGLNLYGSWFVTWEQYQDLEAALLTGTWLSERIEQVLGSVAGQVAGWSRPRSGGPKPAPQPLDFQAGNHPTALAGLRMFLWESLADIFTPALEGVEAAWRDDYQRACLELRTGAADPRGSRWQPFLQHLIFRKQLLHPPGLLANLCLLHFLPDFLQAFANALAQVRGRQVSDPDCWDALDLAEKVLIYHCRGLRPLYQKAAAWLVQQSAENQG